jgi:G3E family GTPase
MKQTTIVCGLLGAGKTTFIQNILKRQSSEKTVVLVNDFAQTGIDGDVLSVDGIETIELPNGCVCCTLKFDLISTIQSVMKKFDPGHLVIEPSGVAAVSGILEILDILKISPVIVVGIIDAAEFIQLYESGVFGSFLEDQVRNSDIILINKTDIASPELVTGTAAVVEGLNPGALVYRTVRAGFNESFSEKRRGPLVKTENPDPFQFDTLSVTLRDGLDASAVRDIFHSLGQGEYGEVVRAKALVRTSNGPMRFDLVYGKTDAETFSAPIGRSRLVIIGKNLKKDAVNKELSILKTIIRNA